LPSAIRLDGYDVPDAFRSCAESRCKEALTDKNAALNASDTEMNRIGLVCSLILVNANLHGIMDHFTGADCSPHQPAVNKTDSGAEPASHSWSIGDGFEGLDP